MSASALSLFVSVVVVVSGPTLAQSTWFVDVDACPGPGSGTHQDPFCVIQQGIDAASGGDTVLVAPGTYYGDLNFLGKAIAVRSTAGPGQTTIMGSGTNAVVTFESREGPDSTLEEFTVTGGLEGVVCDSASPRIVGNVITQNVRNGVYCNNGSAAWIEGNTISDNNGAGSGAASGGGILCRTSSDAVIRNNLICRNESTGTQDWVGGGGVAMIGSSPLIEGNTIVDNVAIARGGGVYVYSYSHPIIVGNVIANNQCTSPSNGRGGAIAVRNSSTPLISRNTLFGNSAAAGGDAVYLCCSSTVTLENSILWQMGPSIISGSGASVTYCDVQGGWPGTGNINADPLFVDGPGGDFHLQVGSPCIDTGNPRSDLDCDGTVADMGAFPSVPVGDCDNNGIPDCQEIGEDSSLDCNANNILDTCEIAADSSLDLNLNDVLDSCECLTTNYCIIAPNSTGLFARISSDGPPSLSLNSFSLTANGLPPSQFGVFFFGPLQVELPFGDGYRCVGGLLTRLDPPMQFDENGLVQRPLDFTQAPLGGLVAGDTTHFQLWYRDPQPVGFGFNLTNALQVTLCP